MSEKDMSQLEQADNWDYENAERRPAVKKSRVIVSVAFPRADFERVAEYAERMAKRTSEFIREAALERATLESAVTGFYWTSGSPGYVLFTNQLPPTTIVWASPDSKGELQQVNS